MKTSLKLLALVICPLITVSLVRAADDSSVPHGDKSFAKKAAMGGMYEVTAGKLAQERATSQEVKDFGGQMVQDHGKANDELKSIAATKGIELPDSLDMTHKAMIDKLGMKNGADFDKAYVADMVSAHKADNAAFQKEAKNGKDAEIKEFAAKTDEVIKHHIEMLNGLSEKK